MSAKSNLVMAAAVLCAVVLNSYQYQVNRDLEAKISTAQKAAAKPKARANTAVARKTTITQGGGEQQISLAILQAPGSPTILRKVGAKFYPLTVNDIRKDPDLMKQLSMRFASIPSQVQSMLQGFGLSSTALESFHDTIADRDAQTFLLFLEYSQPNLSDGDLASFDVERQTIYNDADAKISVLINNEDNFADYKAAMDQDDTEEHALQTFTSYLNIMASRYGEDLALSPEQNDSLLSIMQEERANSGLPDPFLAHLLQASGSDPTAFAQVKDELLSSIMDRAAQILTPDQFAVFQQRPPDLMAMEMRSKIAQNLSGPIRPSPFPKGEADKSGQLTIFPAGSGGFSGFGGNFSYGIKLLPTSQ